WLWLRPGDAPPLSAKRSKIDRLSRLRCLSSGSLDGAQWHAFIAPTGCPLTDLIAAEGKGEWPQARTVMEGLADELAQACDEGTLPEILTPAQVWVEPNGRIKLLDMPLADTEAASKGSDDERALTLLAEVAVLILEGRQIQAGAVASDVQAAVPRHAAAMLQRL